MHLIAVKTRGYYKIGEGRVFLLTSVRLILIYQSYILAKKRLMYFSRHSSLNKMGLEVLKELSTKKED